MPALSPASIVEAAVGGASVARVDRRQLALIGALFVLTSLGWVLTDVRMSGMDQGPWTDPGSLGFYLSAWVVMMGAAFVMVNTPLVELTLPSGLETVTE